MQAVVRRRHKNDIPCPIVPESSSISFQMEPALRLKLQDKQRDFFYRNTEVCLSAICAMLQSISLKCLSVCFHSMEPRNTSLSGLQSQVVKGWTLGSSSFPSNQDNRHMQELPSKRCLCSGAQQRESVKVVPICPGLRKNLQPALKSVLDQKSAPQATAVMITLQDSFIERLSSWILPWGWQLFKISFCVTVLWDL